MLLSDLLRLFDPRASLGGVAGLEISGVTDDSRRVEPGDLFIARAGAKTDGRQFLADALARGAVAAVVAAKASDIPLPQVVLPDPAAAVSPLAHLFYGRPSDKIKVLGVTGTNGKTTVAYLVRHILKKLNARCGMIGTVEIDDGKVVREATMTTPGAVEIAQLMAEMRDKGCRACAIETSSHALDQGRVSAVTYAGAAFTNLTGDHLDYHGSMENYAAAKSRLFTMLDNYAVAVVNDDDRWTPAMIANCRGRIIRFGFGKGADYRARDISITAAGARFILHTPDGRAEAKIGLIGKHNIENVLAAAALTGEVFGLSVHQIVHALADAPGAPGRLQSVSTGQPFAVLVDYAHTDDALENVLTALRPLTKNKLRVVFGCGGDRDRTKRPRMARTAGRLADVVYVTSDNPRTENPHAIIEEICAGFPATVRSGVIVEPDRRSAIAQALSDAQAGDVVLVAGKGHENYQIIGATKHHFDDVEEARASLAARSAA